MPDSGLSQDDAKQIFSLGSQNVMVKCNFPGMFKDTKCVSDQCLEKDSTRHVFYCKYLEEKKLQYISKGNIHFEEIYSEDIEKQLAIKNIFMQKYKTRNRLLSSK